MCFESNGNGSDAHTHTHVQPKPNSLPQCSYLQKSLRGNLPARQRLRPTQAPIVGGRRQRSASLNGRQPSNRGAVGT